MTKLNVKEWVIDKEQATARCYNTYFDYERDENGLCKTENGYMTVFCDEIIRETEKAIQVILRTGDTVGSVKGWKCWIPKSQILLN